MSSYAQSGREQRLIDSLVRVADSMSRLDVPGISPDGVPDSMNAARLPITDSMIALTDSAQKAAMAADSTLAAAKRIEESYVISGTVKDKATGEGIPFATVFFPGSDIGTPADLDGRFTLSFLKPPGDTFRVTAIGYSTWNQRFNPVGKRNRTLLIELNRQTSALSEFVFLAGEDPAITLLKRIIAAKPANNPDRLQQYKYGVYNKLEVDIRNLSRKQFERLPVPMIKQFGFIYDNLDSTSEQRPYLPFFLTETLSDYYFQREPKKTREIIRAINVKGVRNESVDQFLGSNYQNVNAYNNYIPVFDKSFVSPISSNGAFYYKYRIKDTQMAYGYPIILVEFRPRRDGENCFNGDFWVVDSVYAIQRISLEVPKNANINFVSRLSLYQETAPMADSMWFTIKDKFVCDFNLPYNPKLPGFIGRKTTHYRDIQTAADSVLPVLNNKELRKDVIVAGDAREYDDTFWDTARPDTLSKNERAIYAMVDTLNTLPVFKSFKRTMKLLFGGFVTVGPVDIGPYYNIYSRNQVEGDRFRLGLATNPRLWKDLRLSGYAAYGMKDQELKYYGDAFWITNRKQRTYLYASYRNDIDRSNHFYDNQVTPDNIFANIGRKAGVVFKLAMVKDARFEYYQEFYSGFSHMVTLQHRSFDPFDPLPSVGIFLDDDGRQQDKVVSSDVGLRFRYAYKEEFIEANYFRQSLGSKYPIVELRGNLGLKGVLGSGYKYKKAAISVSDYVKIAPFGSIYYNVFGGKVFGTLPYPLLEVHPGNEFLYYSRQAFNMMTRYEFISDQYAGFNFEHSIGGGIFNYIPLLKKARLRQFWTAKGIVGSLNEENKKLNLDKGYTFRTLEGSPYIEVGTGVENILQVLRIDFIWRVTPKALPTEDRAKYFGIFGSVRFRF